jgi:hypothetical protein
MMTHQDLLDRYFESRCNLAVQWSSNIYRSVQAAWDECAEYASYHDLDAPEIPSCYIPVDED